MNRIDELCAKLNDRSELEARKLLFQWVKTGVVSFAEFNVIIDRRTKVAEGRAVLNVLTSRD